MKKITTYQNKKILVLGLARSGMAAAKLLHSLGAFVTVNDGKPFEENPSAQELLDIGIKVIAGSHPVELLDEDYALMVKNPGVPYNNPMVKKALERKIPIITEIELAGEVLEGQLVAITGTNGKTTTTTMIGALLNGTLKKGQAYLAGNIGYPASEVAPNLTKDDVMVTENSSFQLMGIESYHPHIAVITNVYSAHLDYHGSQEAYEKAKWEIQKNMTKDDVLILNDNQEKMHEWAKYTNATVKFFSTKQKVSGAYCLEDTLYFGEEEIMKVKDLGVPGSHNVENALAAITVAKLFHAENRVIAEVLGNFHGVPHRTQYITTIKGRRFFNDSKATNSLATKRALSGFDNEKTILLAGGLDRGNGFDDLIPDFKNLKGIITFGETKKKLQDTAKKAQVKEIYEVGNMQEAVKLAYDISKDGDTILLSPANASWDQYKSFEERGDLFIACVKDIQKEEEK